MQWPSRLPARATSDCNLLSTKFCMYVLLLNGIPFIIIIHHTSNSFSHAGLGLMHHLTEYWNQLKLWISQHWHSPMFKTVCVTKTIWRIINKITSIWRENMLGYTGIFVLRRYLLLLLLSFPQAMFSESCSLLGIDRVRRQIFNEHVFAINGG